MEPDFGGYATVHNVKCSDGLTILPDAFKHQDGKKVPLVWQHSHNEPLNVLGYAILENRPFGVYTRGYFNSTDQAQAAKAAVQHGDITAMSIWANRLKKQAANVQYGDIKEVSLVFAGANPGAVIDKISLKHGDVDVEVEDEAIIYSGLEYGPADIEHSDTEDAEESDDETTDEVSHAVETDDTKDESMADKDETVKDILESLSPKQKDVVQMLLTEALQEGQAAHSDEGDDADESDDSSDSTDDTNTDDTVTHDQEDQSMTRNVFDQTDAKDDTSDGYVLTHSDKEGIFAKAKSMGSLKEAVDQFTLQHNITDIDVLFPDAKAVSDTPEFQKRRTEWVAKVMDSTHHTPFSRIKSVMADLQPDEARAKGYIKGNLKKEEFFKVSKRVTTPQTIYKKQKLERDDVVDITDFDVVTWMKGEMRLMLEEEVARAILIGDGRSQGDEDKIDEDHVRSILNDHELYVTKVYVNISGTEPNAADNIVDRITLERHHYRGSGSPTFFTSETILARLLTAKDTLGRRLYKDVSEVASALRVTEIVPVEVFESVPDLVGIMVDLRDYNVGTTRGGEVTLFDDFDIDYNQLKYLIETRLSGALVKWKAAIVVMSTASGATLVDPITAPTFNETTGVVTIPTQTGVTYKNKITDVTLIAGAQTALDEGDVLEVLAVPASSSYYFNTNAHDEWTFVGVTDLP